MLVHAPIGNTKCRCRRVTLSGNTQAKQQQGHALGAQISAAIGVDRLPVDIARGGAAEESHRGRDILRAAPFGRPVRVHWTREDEMSQAPFGAAMAIEIEADLDAEGEVVDWRHSVWSTGHATRPGRAAQPASLAGFELEKPFPRMISSNPPQANGGGADRNAIPLYDFPSWQIESHRLLTMPVRTSALRTLGAQGNVFAIECFLDEVAAARGEDLVAYRLRHLSDERAKQT
jgi:CO/xanthine dehydrogenase Mo-binding subunit